jgi:multidrug efflux pump subunit AcrA (membrane-fusion protein)
VQWQTLQTDTLQDSTDFVSTLEAEQTVKLKPQIDGRIDRILVKPGAQAPGSNSDRQGCGKHCDQG